MIENKFSFDNPENAMITRKELERDIKYNDKLIAQETLRINRNKMIIVKLQRRIEEYEFLISLFEKAIDSLLQTRKRDTEMIEFLDRKEAEGF